MDASKLKGAVLRDLLESQGWDSSDPKNDVKKKALDKIQQMSLYEAFDEYLKYNGIINYTSDIKTAFEQLLIACAETCSSCKEIITAHDKRFKNDDGNTICETCYDCQYVHIG